MEVTATAIACGQEFLHEFWFQFPSSRAPVAFWIPGYDKTYTAAQWYEHYWSSIQLNLDEGTVLAFICQCSSDCPVIPSQSCAGENANRPGPSSHHKHGGSTEATGPLSLSTADAIACDVGHFVFCGLVGSKDRPKKTQGCTPDWHRTQLKGLQVMLLLGVNLSIRHLLPAGWEVMPGIPSAMLTPADTVLQVSAIVKVGKTLGGSQLLNIANLPAVHYPFVLGIPRQLPCAPFTVEHQDAITDSLFLLLKLFVTQDCSMMAFSSFCKQMLQEAMQDSGHLISTVAAIGGCLATGRSSLALAGIFGAGKTTSMTFILMWLALTTPPQVRLTVVSKENPAGQAIAAQVERMQCSTLVDNVLSRHACK